VFRNAGDSTSLKSDRLEVSLSEMETGNTQSLSNVSLQANDVIQLFTNSEFGDQQFVEIFGEVRREGKIRKYGGMTLEDLIYLSGGLRPSAEYGRLEISSIVDLDSAQRGLRPTRTIIKSYSILNNLELDSTARNVQLKPYDQIFVRKNPTFELQQNVSIYGLVKYQGFYPRLSKYERLTSYIQRAGGVMENANLAGAVLYRSKTDLLREKIVNKPKFDSLGRMLEDSAILALSQPVSIDLYKALKHPNSKHDIVLQENDIIYIPEINPFVNIQGRVQSPLKITFDKEHTNLSYYIDKAGGYGIRPWRRRIFVTYANGRSRRTKNLFFIERLPFV
jgi:protein involved in polysaccharide export with SLBB domain